MSIFKWSAALMFAAVIAGGATSSSAITYDFTSDHCTGGCGTPPFGSVTLTQNGTSVGFVIDLFNNNGWAQTGAGDFQLFKFNATGVLVTDITVTQTFAGQTLAAQTGAFNGDGTGNFTFGIACTTCGNGNLGITSDVVFSVANATIADFTAPNNLGNVFVADIFSGETGLTGPVDASAAVPSPVVGAGLPGLVAACGWLVFLARRRRQRNA